MRAITSLARFLAATAAVCVAFSVAISGPPTQTEISWARDALGKLWRNIVGVSADVEAQACVAAGVMCAEEQAVAEEARTDAAPPIEGPPAPPLPHMAAPAEPIAPPQRSAELLGDDEIAAPPRVEPRAERPRAHRPRAEVRREPLRNRRPPPPLPPVGVQRADALEPGTSSELAEVRRSRVPQLNEEPSAYEADWPADWDQYREAPSDDAEEAYTDEYDSDEVDEEERAYEEYQERQTRARFWRERGW